MMEELVTLYKYKLKKDGTIKYEMLVDFIKQDDWGWYKEPLTRTPDLLRIPFDSMNMVWNDRIVYLLELDMQKAAKIYIAHFEKKCEKYAEKVAKIGGVYGHHLCKKNE